MTIREIIDTYSAMRKPPLDTHVLLRIISGMERRIIDEILSRCEGGEITFTGYKPSDLGRECLAKSPYDMIYVWACCHKTDLRDGAVNAANNSLSLQEDILKKFGNYWIREHAPKGAKNISDRLHNV